MPIVVNSNTTATTSSFNLASAISALRKSLASLRSGKRIDSPADDAGEQSLADNIHSWINRPRAVRQNIQNGLSYLQVQGGSLETIGSMLSRIAEFRTMASVATENLVELENYSKEFIDCIKNFSKRSAITLMELACFAQTADLKLSRLFHRI